MFYRQTKTGDLVQMREYHKKDVTYGFISIKPKNKYSNLNEAEQVLSAFMVQLQHSFAIEHTTGPQVETFLQCPKTAITNYWQDGQQVDWKVKGWTDGITIAVLYIRNISAVPVSKEEYFLNGTFFIQV